jgi:hypothetical protein
VATSFGEVGGGSALEQRETRERDDGRVNEESNQVGRGGVQQNGHALHPGWLVHVGCWGSRGTFWTIGDCKI